MDLLSLDRLPRRVVAQRVFPQVAVALGLCKAMQAGLHPQPAEPALVDLLRAQRQLCSRVALAAVRVEELLLHLLPLSAAWVCDHTFLTWQVALLAPLAGSAEQEAITPAQRMDCLVRAAAAAAAAAALQSQEVRAVPAASHPAVVVVVALQKLEQHLGPAALVALGS